MDHLGTSLIGLFFFKLSQFSWLKLQNLGPLKVNYGRALSVKISSGFNSKNMSHFARELYY